MSVNTQNPDWIVTDFDKKENQHIGSEVTNKHGLFF